MAIYYVDPAATGANDGSSWTDAWTDYQSAADTVTGGDTAYCRGTQTLTAPIDHDTNSGSLGSGYCKFIGCNAAGNVDGTCFVLDAYSTAANCLRGVTTARTFIWFENFEFKNATGDGVSGMAGNDYWVFVNCLFHDNGGSGFDYSAFDYLVLVGCRAYNNSNHGFDSVAILAWNIFLLGCVSYNNGDYGIHNRTNGICIGCISHDNGATDAGFYIGGIGAMIINCVADGENVGFLNTTTDHMRFFFNRITNNTTGINFSNELSVCGWNYLHGNTTDLSNPSSWSDPGVYAAYIAWKSTTNSNQADVDADDGYNNRANDDFNLKASRTYNGDGNDVIDLGIGS